MCPALSHLRRRQDGTCSRRARAASQPGSQHVDLAAWRGRVEAVLDQPADHSTSAIITGMTTDVAGFIACDRAADCVRLPGGLMHATGHAGRFLAAGGEVMARPRH
jgi:hypothetical protein